MTEHGRPLGWGILGLGGIAERFAAALARSHTGWLAAVASRDPARTAAFAARHGSPKVHAGYDALLADPAVACVYVATTHPHHAQWTIRAAEAGKHVLCEKPIGLNHAEAMVAVEAARRAGTFLMEAFMYRTHPQTARIHALIREGALGRVRMINANFGYRARGESAVRERDPEQGGGAILDVGCYTLSMARLIAGADAGTDVLDPDRLAADAVIIDGADRHATATVRFPSGAIAALACGIDGRLHNEMRICGSEATLIVPSPWFCGGIDGGDSRLTLLLPDGTERHETISDPRPLYAIEADAVGEAIAAGAQQCAALPWADTLGNMRWLDAWREAVGLVYPAELPARQRLPFHGRTLARRGGAPMTYGTIPGLDKPVARLALGSIRLHPMPFAAALLDTYFEAGGNVIETAHTYSQGRSETMIGHWLANRGVRKNTVLITKGAQTPHCHPQALSEQLLISLDRLQVDGVDLYMMHRDNPDYPVETWIDLLNAHRTAGRFVLFGASNWTLDRLRAANAYAARSGQQGFAVLSNQFSLARMIEPPWELCLSSNDAAYRAWLEQTQLPSLPWSSQARGFFTGRAAPDRRDDPELARCWYSDDNFERKRRAEALARSRGVEPIALALAWVLHQPFPTFPIIGPLAVAEIGSSLAALAITLSPAELAWLDLAGPLPETRDAAAA